MLLEDGRLFTVTASVGSIFHKRFTRFSGYIFVLLILVAWETFSRSGLIHRVFLPPPSEIIYTLFYLFANPGAVYHLPQNMAFTLYRMAAGYILAAAVAVPLGILIGYYRLAYRLLSPLVELLRPLPPVAVVPIFLLLLGIGDTMYIPFVAFGSLWPILINSTDGVRNVDSTLLDTARIFKIGRLQTLTKVILPAASPFIMSGLRISLLVSLLITIVAEMTAGGSGLGWSTLYAQYTTDSLALYAQVFILSVYGYILHRLFLKAEDRLMLWRRIVTIQR